MRLVLFDCDGTLVDSQHVIASTMVSAFAEHGIAEPDRERILGIIGLSLEQAIGQLLDIPVGKVVEDVAASYRSQFFKRRHAGPIEPLFPGAHAAVTTLCARDDVLLGIVTGKSRRGVDAILGGHELLDHFVTIQTADDAPSKPHPGMVLQAIAETGADKVETVVVGDTTFDMEMARAAGASALGVDWGYHPAEDLPGAGAEAVLTTFDDLLPWLDARWNVREPAV